MNKKQTKLLYMDDDQTQLLLAKAHLKDSTLETRCTCSLEEYLYVIKEQDFDLILLDIVMPDINGIELARKTKSLNPNVPIIAVTGYGAEAEHMLREEEERLFIDVIAKPDPWDKLLKKWL